MDKHYYFVSQLPSLFFDVEAGISLEAFFAEGEKWLSDWELDILSRVSTDDTEAVEGDPDVLQGFRAFEFNMRTDLALWRRTRGTDQEYRPSGFPVSIVRDGTPLEAERELLKLRWNYIENEAPAHHYDLEFLILYCLKLQILRRLFSFNKEEGLKTFQTLCEVEV